MPNALERRKVGKVHVIPIILRPCDWKKTPIGEIQALPTNGTPITGRSDRDEAFQHVTSEIGKVVETLLSQKARELEDDDPPDLGELIKKWRQKWDDAHTFPDGSLYFVIVPNTLLKEARKKTRLTQREVAERIGTEASSVGQWERGESFPDRDYHRKLCELFGKTAEELGLTKDKSHFRRN